MTVKIFDNGDESYLNWMANNPNGYVLNRYRSGRSQNYLVIHKAGCNKISEYNDMSKPQGFTTRGYIKVCSTDLPSLRRYAQSCGRTDGTFSGKCRVCNPNIGSPNQHHLSPINELQTPSQIQRVAKPLKPTRTTKATSSVTPPSQPNPFTEGRVETLLEPWLVERGFTVNKRVRVSNGIIDIVAYSATSKWIIEAKGEDRGGYNSAEMNFRIGISQICSRMEQETKNTLYGLAIPMTINFAKVLRKHTNFSVFSQMRIWLLIATDDGTITSLKPDDVQCYMDQLPST